MNKIIFPVFKLRGRPDILGDKSISHRALILGAVARGTSRVHGLLESEDVHSTWKCLVSLGARIKRDGKSISIEGKNLSSPPNDLDCGNSGTTLRLMMGLIAGLGLQAKLVGDASLSRRPMKRLADPLRKMGARIELSHGGLAPVTLGGGSELKGCKVEVPVASAQIKGALLLAGLFAQGETTVTGKLNSRDHMERMLPHFGAKLKTGECTIAIEGGTGLIGSEVHVPGDFSTAAFWLAAACIVPGSEILLEGVSLNPSRLGFLAVLKRMGADITVQAGSKHLEPSGNIVVRYAKLYATEIGSEEIPGLIDELPLVGILACYAVGKTKVSGAEELRVKESDRIEALAQGLRAMGADITVRTDGFEVDGPQKLQGGTIDSKLDHRIAMAFSIAALGAEGATEIQGFECVSVSYPSFYKDLNELTQ